MATDTRVQERGVEYTDTQAEPTAEGSGTYTEPTAMTQFNSAYDSKQTKIKAKRNWYPDIDGNDVTQSYTTGF